MPTDPPKYYGLDDTNGTGKFDRGDDLKPKLKKTLGDYLSELTRTSPTDNKYTIAPGTSEHVTFTDDNGHPSPLVTGQGSGDEVFIDQVAESAKAYFEKVSNSGVFDSAEPTDKFLVDLINKRIQEDGHELLSSIKGTALDDAGNTVTPGEPKTLIEQKIQGVLLNNRFNPSGQSPYVQDGQFSGAFGQKQRKFGKYDEIAEVSYEVEDLTKIACSLLSVLVRTLRRCTRRVHCLGCLAFPRQMEAQVHRARRDGRKGRSTEERDQSTVGWEDVL